MTWAEYFNDNQVQIAETAALNAAGATWKALRGAVEAGHLIRVRRGHYALPGTDARILEAVRVGGRLACVSAAADMGVFAFDNRLAHVQIAPTGSRLRTPHDRFQLLTGQHRHSVELHWNELVDPADGTEYRVGLIDALVQILRCQEPRFALASLDSALHQGLLPPGAIREIFAELPRETQYLQSLVDARSEAGQETVLRFIVGRAGYEFQIQVRIRGIGRIDMIVEGCIAVEADSRQFHDGWDAHARDRTRDCELAMLGYLTLRVLYRDIMFHPERVLAAIAGLLDASRHFRRTFA